VDYPGIYSAVNRKNKEKLRGTLQKAATGRDSTSGPSLPLASYVGTYRDVWYGDVGIAQEGDKLVIRFLRTPELVGYLLHWQHDTFVARWKDRGLRADAYAAFTLNPDGSVRELRMVPESEAVDFSFDFQDLVLRPVSKQAGSQ
jgi:hypothetical protein